MKKKLIYTLTLFVSALFLASCNADFMEKYPTDAYGEAEIMGTTDGLFGSINGMHKNMYKQYNSRQDQSGQGGVNIYMDAMGEDLVWPHLGNGWFRDAFRWIYHRDKSGWGTIYCYEFYYILIANANMILDNVDDATGPENMKKIIKGQALTYRAHAYWNLVQQMAKRYTSATASSELAVPLLTTFTTEAQPRATVAEVYAQIEKDLDEAIVLLDGYTRSGKSHLDKSIAQGIRARVALTKGEWNNAKKYAQDAITSFQGKGRLMNTDEYMDGFSDANNPEWMWGSIIIDDQTLYFYSFHAYMSNFNSTQIRQAPKTINKELYATISDTDVRKNLWEPNPTHANMDIRSNYSLFPLMNRKFKVKNIGSSVGDIVYMRLAEMYLIKAEAEARSGDDASARQTFYTLKSTRDPKYTLSTNSGAALLNEILLDRRVELWGEGFRWYDLKRQGLPLERSAATHNSTVYDSKFYFGPDDPAWQFHFPQKEENTNSYVKENPNP